MTYTYGCFDDEDPTFLNPRCDCSEPCMDHPCEKGHLVPYDEIAHDDTTYHLTDRQLSQIIDSLQFDRDRLIALGYTGKDCQETLDALYRGIKPNTNGLTYRLGQHDRLLTNAEFDEAMSQDFRDEHLPEHDPRTDESQAAQREADTDDTASGWLNPKGDA